jgi:all-trans-retinol 13,14-reductase
MTQRYDIVIIGSGLGGLACGCILSKEGYKVGIIEKNKQIGGNLQTFVRNKCIFDTGIHYIGGLAKGQNLYKFFKFLGIMDDLNLRQMDLNGFDKIIFNNDQKEYRHAQGYENFAAILAADFPEEKEAIIEYCNTIKKVCSYFPLYNLQEGDHYENTDSFNISVSQFLKNLTPNKRLQNVFAGNNLLYAGEEDKTPLYVHALVVNSYIESSWKCLDGGSQIARLLAKIIRQNGGDIIRKTEVKKLVTENEKVIYALLSDGTCIYGNTFISNLHPAKTMELTESEQIRPAYRKRIKSLENSVSTFIINIVFKKNTFRYENCNYYFFEQDNVWSGMNYTEESWPENYIVFFSASSRNSEYAEGITAMAYMKYEEVKRWEHTHNTTLQEDNRGSDYDAFKKEKAEKIITLLEKKFPDIRSSIHAYYVATPLSYRDYIGTDDGHLYGIAKDYRDPMKTYISPKTKIPNLLLTGQNVNLHGVLGVTVSAVLTCSTLLGKNYLIRKIEDAQE